MILMWQEFNINELFMADEETFISHIPLSHGLILRIDLYGTMNKRGHYTVKSGYHIN